MYIPGGKDLFIIYNINGEIIHFDTYQEYDSWRYHNFGTLCGIIRYKNEARAWIINANFLNSNNNLVDWFNAQGWNIEDGFDTEEKRINFKLTWL